MVTKTELTPCRWGKEAPRMNHPPTQKNIEGSKWQILKEVEKSTQEPMSGF